VDLLLVNDRYVPITQCLCIPSFSLKVEKYCRLQLSAIIQNRAILESVLSSDNHCTTSAYLLAEFAERDLRKVNAEDRAARRLDKAIKLVSSSAKKLSSQGLVPSSTDLQSRPIVLHTPSLKRVQKSSPADEALRSRPVEKELKSDVLYSNSDSDAFVSPINEASSGFDSDVQFVSSFTSSKAVSDSLKSCNVKPSKFIQEKSGTFVCRHCGFSHNEAWFWESFDSNKDYPGLNTARSTNLSKQKGFLLGKCLLKS
jgi:hypothetical protein